MTNKEIEKLVIENQNLKISRILSKVKAWALA